MRGHQGKNNAQAAQTLVFPPIKTLTSDQLEVVAGFGEGLEWAHEKARQLLSKLPAGARLVHSLRSPYVFSSESEILAERERIKSAFGVFEVAEHDPLDVLDAAASSPITMAWLYHGFPDQELRRPYGCVLFDAVRKCAPDVLEDLPRRRDGKLRVGYISPQLRNSNSSRWALALAQSHPEADIDLFAFDIGPTQDFVTEKWKRVSDHFLKLEGSVLAMGRAIRDCDLDVLLFTDIGIDGITDVLGTMRLARRQAALWGGPCSTGLKNIDDYLVGEYMVGSEAEFSEKIVKLPGAGVYYDLNLIPAAAGRPEKAPVEPMAFCMQTVAKCHPRWDSLFSQVSVNLGVPILIPQGPSQVITVKAAKRMKAANVNVMFMPKVPEPHFSGILEITSMSVDTPSYNGGITAILALAAGVPIITLPGTSMRDRFGSAFLRQVGLAHHVASTPDEYLERIRHWQDLKLEVQAISMREHLEDSRVPAAVNHYLLSWA